MRISRSLWTVFVTLLVLLPALSRAQMPSTLPSLEGKSTYPLGVNNQGLVVGNAYSLPGNGDGTTQAVVWVEGQISVLGGYASTYATGINDAGVVVGGGYASSESGPVPVFWKDGVIHALPTLGGRGLALDINAQGDMVGWVDTDRFTAPAVWRNGVLTVLQGLRESGGEATAVDDDGRISGFSRGFEGDNLPTEWVADVARALPVSFGEDYIGVLGVNKSGKGRTSGYIIQRQRLENGDTYLINVAVGWQDGQFRTLQRPNGGGNSFANDVNAEGWYVGYTMDAEGRYRPTLWTDEGLSTLAFDSQRSAIAIGANESGTVVGVDYTDVFNPVPLVWQTGDAAQIGMASMVGRPGDSVMLSATLTRGGQPVANKPVSFRVQGKQAGSALTDASGKVSLPFQIPTRHSGTLDVEATSRNVGAYSLRKIEISRADTTAGVAPAKAERGRAITLRASLRATQANRPLSGQTVRFALDGLSLGVAQTDASGIARLRYRVPLDLPLGSHRVEARFGGDSIHRANVGRASLGVMR